MSSAASKQVVEDLPLAVVGREVPTVRPDSELGVDEPGNQVLRGLQGRVAVPGRVPPDDARLDVGQSDVVPVVSEGQGLVQPAVDPLAEGFEDGADEDRLPGGVVHDGLVLWWCLLHRLTETLD